MAGVNKAILLGFLGHDPSIRYTDGGTSVARFSLATTEKVNQEERTEWHRVVAFGRLAEVCSQYLVKGSQVYVEGRLQTREWDGRDGTKKQQTEVIIQTMVMLGGKRKERAERSGPARDSRPQDDTWQDGRGGDDDIPF